MVHLRIASDIGRHPSSASSPITAGRVAEGRCRNLSKLYDGGGKTIGLLHSLGYTRGLLNDLNCSEQQRLTSLVCAARKGLEDERFRAGAADARGEAPALGALLRSLECVVPSPLMAQVGQCWASCQVSITALAISIAWPVAWFMDARTSWGTVCRTALDYRTYIAPLRSWAILATLPVSLPLLALKRSSTPLRSAAIFLTWPISIPLLSLQYLRDSRRPLVAAVEQ